MQTLTMLLSLFLILCTEPSTRPAPAPDEVIAIVAGDRIERDQIEGEPERYPNDHWHKFNGRVIGGLLRVYQEEHRIEATDAEIGEFLAFLRKQSRRQNDPRVLDFDPASPAMRAMGKSWVVSWKRSKALYEQYGGTVIWNQGNPQEPVGAYRALFREHEAHGTVKILDAAYRRKVQQWLDTPDPSFVIPPEKVDYSMPWWRREPDTQPSR
jgi:hypothetical protein